MRRMVTIMLMVFLSLMLLPFMKTSAAAEERQITWLILDLPPLFLTKGPDAGTGLADRIQRMVADRLSGYEHRIQIANASRIALELQEDRQVCFAGEFYGNPDFLTSIPTVVLLPHNLIVRREDAHRFGDGNAVSLEALLQDPDLVFGTARDRLYGPELDAVLKRFQGAKNIHERAGQDTLDGLLGMLVRGRVDYLVEYPVSVRYAAKTAGIEDKVMTIPILENQNALLIRGAIRAPDTAWGRSVIQKINHVLLEIRTLPEYWHILEDWVISPGGEKAYQSLYERYVLDVTE